MPIKLLNELKNLLKETEAVKFGDFTLSSGKKSDFYVDCRRVTLHPKGAKLIGRLILEKIKGLKVDAVGGLTLGADPIIGAVITLSDLSGFIVRKKTKEHGTKQRLEGLLKPGDKVLIVEDVATTGGSALEAIQAAEEAGATVVKVVSVIDREEGATAALAKYNFDSLLRKSDFI